MAKKVNNMLTQRLKKPASSDKMVSLVQNTTDGKMTGLPGAFGVADLEESAQQALRVLLEENTLDTKRAVDADLKELVTITAEVRAIHRQAAILHGERIKKAQVVLKNYRDGTFTTWLVATYGNRQTPYNFLQFYEFHQALPKALHPRLEQMPLQAIYTLASRDAPIRSKRAIVENYRGETKSQLLAMIREAFPLPDSDQRRQNVGEGVVATLEDLCELVSLRRRSITKKYRVAAVEWINELRGLLEE